MRFPKPPRRVKRKKPLRQVGRRGMEWIATRQEVLATLLGTRDRASFACGTRLGVDGVPYVDPEYAAGGEVTVWIEQDKPPYPRLMSDGHLHHHIARSRAPNKRLDITNLVLLTPAKHAEVESRYQKGGPA